MAAVRLILVGQSGAADRLMSGADRVAACISRHRMADRAWARHDHLQFPARASRTSLDSRELPGRPFMAAPHWRVSLHAVPSPRAHPADWSSIGAHCAELLRATHCRRARSVRHRFAAQE